MKFERDLAKQEAFHAKEVAFQAKKEAAQANALLDDILESLEQKVAQKTSEGARVKQKRAEIEAKLQALLEGKD